MKATEVIVDLEKLIRDLKEDRQVVVAIDNHFYPIKFTSSHGSKNGSYFILHI